MLMNTGETPIQSQNGLLTTMGYKIGAAKPVYALEGSIAIAGALVQWLRDNLGLPIPKERWFTNLAWTGNTGSAAIYVMLDELRRSGDITPGQRLLLFVPESGRFSSGFVHLTAVEHA